MQMFKKVTYEKIVYLMYLQEGGIQEFLVNCISFMSQWIVEMFICVIVILPSVLPATDIAALISTSLENGTNPSRINNICCIILHCNTSIINSKFCVPHVNMLKNDCSNNSENTAFSRFDLNFNHAAKTRRVHKNILKR